MTKKSKSKLTSFWNVLRVPIGALLISASASAITSFIKEECKERDPDVF